MIINMNEKKVREAIGRLQVGINAKREMIKYNKAFFQKQDNSYLESDIEVYCAAIEALEKQLPKKPKQADEQRIRYCTTHACPGCGKEFTGMVSEYCYHCGQRIEYDD